MFPKCRAQHNPVLDVRTQKLLWSNVVREAVTHNSYEIDIQIKVLTWLEDGRDDLLLNLADELSSAVHEDREKHYLAHQLAALIRKFPHLSLDIDPKGVCRENLRSTEWRAKWVNRKIRASRKRPSSIDSLVHYARQYIVRVLSQGEPRDETGFRVPSPNLHKIFGRCSLTGGAVVGVHGNATNILRKLEGSWSCTPDNYSYALAAVARNVQLSEMLLANNQEFICWDQDVFASKFADKVVLVDANIGSSVAKTAKTDRGIAVEPWLNLFVQTGINAVLRDKLAKCGLNLSSQKTNQDLALHATRDNDPDGYCTIDLSNASDSLATEVVRELLPPEWFEVLDRTRSRFTRLAGEEGYAATERFCSMGNGFCFPLQTLIFASIVYASARESDYDAPFDFTVYGDDIIVRRGIFERVIHNLRVMGFQPNSRKTFSEGPFRESCGVDAHSGIDVRPIYCDGLDTVAKVYNLHNQSIRCTYTTEYFNSIRILLRKWMKKNRTKYFLVSPYDPTVRFDDEERVDGAFWVPFDVAITHRDARYHLDTWSWSFKLLYPEIVMDQADVCTHHPVMKCALTWAALTGGSSTAPFVLRYTQRFKLKRFWGPTGWLPGGVFA